MTAHLFSVYRSLIAAIYKQISFDSALIFRAHPADKHDISTLHPVIQWMRGDEASFDEDAFIMNPGLPQLPRPGARLTFAEEVVLLQKHFSHSLAIPLKIQQAEPDLLLLTRPQAFTEAEQLTIENLCSLAVIALEQAEQAEGMRKSQARFLAKMAHELRAPLNTINGFLDLTLDGVGGDLNEQQREFLRRARTSSEQYYALLEDLLLVSRSEIGQVRLNREVICLQDVITNAVEEMELTAADHEITISVAIAPDFPPIYADEVRLQQVLRNLLSNALRFTDPGGEVTISASLHPDLATASDERMVEIQIHDTGSGIPLEEQQHLFERNWYQTEQKRTAGRGLGLVIVKLIMDLHDGTLSVQSAPGQGSTFRCVFPHLLS